MEVLNNFSLYLIILLAGYYVYGHNDLTVPEIFPEGDEYVINATQTFSLRCSGKNFVTWTAPDNAAVHSEEEVSSYSNITIESSTTPDSKYPYGSVLTIWNASFLDVGYYYCYENTTDFNDLSRVSMIYIYVYDINTLSVISQFSYAITAVEYSDAVLPCRPTSPDVKVELRQTTGEEVPLDIEDASGTFVTYNPKEGYTIHKATTYESILYNCKFSRGDDFYNLFVLLTVEEIPYSIAKPLLEEVSDGHTIVGQNLMLKCTLRYIKPFVMNWIVPNKNGIQSGQINISKSTKTQNDDEYFQNLEIENTTLADQGEYTCIVRSTQHVNNDTKFIKVYDHMEHFINLTEQNNIYNISIETKAPEVQWFIDVNAHPIPKLIWYNNKDKEIQTGWQSNDNLKYVIDIESGKYAFLKINNITIFDRGYYKLKAINDFEEKTLILFLNVRDKPSVDIQMKNFHKIREPSIIRCKVAAYPEATINWFYKPCLYRGCNYTHVLSTRVETNGLLQTAYLNITANHTGYILCTANNSLGSDEVSKGFFVTDVKNGFGIWGLDEDTIEAENNISRYPVAVGDDLIIYCAASHYNYTSNLKWYKQVSGDTILIESDNHYNIEKGSTEYSNKVTLTIPNVSYNDSGKYLCVVENKTNFDVRVNDNVIITVRDPEKPAFISTNLNNTDLLMMSPTRLEMTCMARGIPKPVITWYKNGEEMLEILPKNKMEMAQNNQIMIFKYTDFEDEGTYTCKASNKIGSAQREMRLKFKNKPGFNYIYIIVIVVLTVLFVIILILILIKYRKEMLTSVFFVN